MVCGLLYPRLMRMLAVVGMLLSSGALASGTLVNTEPDVLAGIQVRPSPRVRLLDINDELRSLEHRTPGPAIFTQKMTSLTPFLMLSAAPLLGLGAFYGLGGKGSIDAIGGLLLAAAAGVVVAVGAMLVVVSAMAVLDHWVAEATTAGQRQARIAQLRTEQHALMLRL